MILVLCMHIHTGKETQKRVKLEIYCLLESVAYRNSRFKIRFYNDTKFKFLMVFFEYKFYPEVEKVPVEEDSGLISQIRFPKS